MNHLKNFFIKTDKEVEQSNTYQHGFRDGICFVGIVYLILYLIESLLQ